MKKHTYLISAIIGVVVLAMAYNAWRIFVKQDYILTDFIACEPSQEDCFVNVCEDCEEIPKYFKMLHKRAYLVKGCDEPDHNCLPLSCKEGEKGCTIEYCNKDNSVIGYPCDEVDN